MSARARGGPALAITATLVGGLAAVVAAAGLAALARPSDEAARTAALSNTLDRLQRLERAPVGGLVYPKGAVCRDGVAQATAKVEQTLRGALGQAKLVSLSFQPASETTSGGVAAVGLILETEGSHEDAMAMLGSLRSARPLIFADTVDLETRTSAVALHFSGRFYCSTSARL